MYLPPRVVSDHNLSFPAMSVPPPTEPVEDPPPNDGLEDDFEDEFAVSEYNGTHMSQFSSVTSSVYAHCYEHGRRYHVYKHGRYPIPNDDMEQGREEMKHVMLKELLDGKLFLCPVEDPQKIMDLGTGTGIWAIEVGDMFPGASVIGTDLSPIQPTWVPPNVSFIVEDMEDDWVHQQDFDFIFLRHMISMLRAPGKLAETALNHLKPGGYIEFQELRPYATSDDNTLTPTHPLHKFYRFLDTSLKRYGFDIFFADKMPAVLEEAGYVEVERKVFKIPIGGWSREDGLHKLIGYYFRTILLDFIAAMMTKPFAEMEMERQECERLLGECGEAFDDPDIHGYILLHVIWGRKRP